MFQNLSPASSPSETSYFDTQSADAVLDTSWIADRGACQPKHTAAGDMVRTLNHELRTPLTIIQVVIELLLDPTVRNGERNRLLEQLERNACWMTSILDNLALWADAQDARLTQSFTQVSIRDMLQSAVSLARPLQAVRHQRVRLVCPNPTPWVSGNLVWLRQAMINLLINASHYSHPDDVVDVCVEAGEQIRISVVDHGPGISEREQAHLFERYVRGIQSTENKVDGHGLGLFIVRTIVELHGGSVGIKSTSGQGTTIWFSLPSPTTEAPVMIGQFAGQREYFEDLAR